MARVLAAVSCVVAAFHAVAERPQKSGARLEREPKDDQDGAFERRIGGLGNTLEEHTANIEHRKKLITDSSTEGQDAQGGYSAMNVSFAELGRLDVECPRPDVLYPNVLPEGSTTKLGGALGDAYKVSIKDCPDMVMKPIGVPAGNALLLERAQTEVFVGKSLLQEPGLVSTLGYAEHPLQQGGACVYMLMDYANNGDVKTALTRTEPNFMDWALIFHKTLVALARLHELGIVHRNIAPENIFIHRKLPIFADYKDNKKYNYKPRIGEFRSSCCYRDDCLPRLKGVQVANCGEGPGGTAGYMSPRVVDSPTPDDDLWSMGKLLLQIVYHQADVYFTETEKKYSPVQNMDVYYQQLKAKNVGTPLLSQADRQKLTDTKVPGRVALEALLDFLLCSGCKAKEKINVDAKAVELSAKWLQNLGIKPENPTKDSVNQGCVEKIIR